MKHLLNTLYILTEGSDLHLQNETIAVHVGGTEKVRIPAHTVDSIYCFGNVTVSTPLIGFCGEHGITIAFFSRTGRFYGRIQGPVSGNILLRRMQFAAVDDPVTQCRLVKHILLGKLYNARQFLLRQGRERPQCAQAFADAADRISRCAGNLKDSISVEEMLGIEGAAASAYFSVFSQMLARDTLSFSGRNRRPPEDPVNALLSFLYTLLKNDVQSALEAVGLDPAAGFLHSLRPGRPALALDLMEELRAPQCDRMAVSLINLGQISEKSFEQTVPPVLLNEQGRKTVITAWQKRKQDVILHPFLKEKIPIGLIPYAQARLLAKVLRGELDEYPPFAWR
jgi:CRISPR-associated protein Cas1